MCMCVCVCLCGRELCGSILFWRGWDFEAQALAYSMERKSFRFMEELGYWTGGGWAGDCDCVSNIGKTMVGGSIELSLIPKREGESSED